MKIKYTYSLFLCCSLFLLLNNYAYSQQQIQETQFLYNTNVINPGYAGYNDKMQFIASHRMQWAGLEGAPVTQTLTFGMPLLNNKLNVGAFVCNETIGAKGLTTFQGNISYHLHLPDGFLSFGIRGGIMNWRVKRSEMNYHDPNDPSSLVNSSNSMVANLDAGIAFSKKGFLFGASAFNLNEPVFFNSGSGDINQLLIHYYSYAGYRFKLNQKLTLRTTALVKYVKDAPLNYEGNIALIIKEKFHTAVTYRSSGMIGIMMQMYLNDKLHFGYSFDYTINDLKNYAPAGTHEIFIGYTIFAKGKPMVTPRFL
jgi:type IX secretion system PorP/SprF family membrane protein